MSHNSQYIATTESIKNLETLTATTSSKSHRTDRFLDFSVKIYSGENVVFNGVSVCRDSDRSYGLWDLDAGSFCPL